MYVPVRNYRSKNCRPSFIDRSKLPIFTFSCKKEMTPLTPPPSGYVHLSHVLTTSGDTLSGKSVGSHPLLVNATFLFYNHSKFWNHHIYCISKYKVLIVYWLWLRKSMMHNTLSSKTLYIAKWLYDSEKDHTINSCHKIWTVTLLILTSSVKYRQRIEIFFLLSKWLHGGKIFYANDPKCCTAFQIFWIVKRIFNATNLKILQFPLGNFWGQQNRTDISTQMLTFKSEFVCFKFGQLKQEQENGVPSTSRWPIKIPFDRRLSVQQV